MFTITGESPVIPRENEVVNWEGWAYRVDGVCHDYRDLSGATHRYTIVNLVSL